MDKQQEENQRAQDYDGDKKAFAYLYQSIQDTWSLFFLSGSGAVFPGGILSRSFFPGYIPGNSLVGLLSLRSRLPGTWGYLYGDPACTLGIDFYPGVGPGIRNLGGISHLRIYTQHIRQNRVTGHIAGWNAVHTEKLGPYSGKVYTEAPFLFIEKFLGQRNVLGKGLQGQTIGGMFPKEVLDLFRGLLNFLI